MPNAIVGQPKPIKDQYIKEFEEVFIPYINTSDEDIIQTFSDLEELINSSGETFNSDDVPVNLNDPDQSLFFAEVSSYFCDSTLKGAGPEGEDYTIFSDQACVLNANGDVIFQLFQGGSYVLGDSDNDPETPVVIDESVVWPCGSAGVYCIRICRIKSRNEIKPVPEIIVEPQLYCTSYSSLGPTSTYGPNGFLENPALFDDPPPEAGDPDFTCTNHYPICIEVEDAVVTTDGGATWNNLTFPMLTCYNDLSDVPYRDDGYGLGFSGLTDLFDQQLAQYDMGMKPTGINGFAFEYGATATQATHQVKIIWRWVIQGGNCEGAFDPWHAQWTNEWQYTGTDGQIFQSDNGLQPASGWSLPSISGDSSMGECVEV